jgi:hypothetical protein
MLCYTSAKVDEDADNRPQKATTSENSIWHQERVLEEFRPSINNSRRSAFSSGSGLKTAQGQRDEAGSTRPVHTE